MLDPIYVKTLAPELEDTEDTIIQFWIDQAKLSVAPQYWGSKYNLGVGLLAAHYLISNSPGQINSSTQGDVTQEKNGDLSRTYGASAGAGVPDDFNGTTYGIWFYNLRKTIIRTPVIV